MKKIIVDGNDGTGKTTLVKKLILSGFAAEDRGIPTKMTDYDSLQAEPNKEIYIILNSSVEESRKKLKKANKDLNEKYHTEQDLTYYRKKYFEVFDRLNQMNDGLSLLVDVTNLNEIQVFETVKAWLKTVC